MFLSHSPYFVDLNARAVSCVAGIIIKSPSVVILERSRDFESAPGSLCFQCPTEGCLSHRGLSSVPQKCLPLPFITPLSFCLLTYVYGALYTGYGAGPCGYQSDKELELHQSQCHRETRGSQRMRSDPGGEQCPGLPGVRRSREL